LHAVPGRIAHDGDPWAEIRSYARTLGEPRRQLQKLLDEQLVA
jgi:hypothetical protein